jgi:aryl-alcohol dehydrogenase-like predicted oxidoreductase
LKYCAEKKLSFIAWSPLRAGLISERYLDKSRVKSGDRLVDENVLDKELTPKVLEKLTGIHKLAQEMGVTLTQLVIAYMLHIPGMGPIIVGCSRPEQVSENAKAGRIKLEQQQIAKIEEVLRK